jgi:hypothetical protein
MKEKLEKLLDELKKEMLYIQSELILPNNYYNYYSGAKTSLKFSISKIEELINNIDMTESESIEMNKCKICNTTQPEHRINENNICITCERDELLIDLGLKEKNNVDGISPFITEINRVKYEI